MGIRPERWTLANILPVVFVFLVAGSIWLVYVLIHLRRLLQFDALPEEFDEGSYRRGGFQLWVSQVLTLLFLINFGLAIFVDPGSVPKELHWLLEDEKGGRTPGGRSRRKTSSSDPVPISHEAKRSGMRRYCKWCMRYKPDRCHHCRVCNSCVLRMDHHCPWIANCVGFRNHKYFLLLVIYAFLICHFMWITQLESVSNALMDECSRRRRFALVFGQTICVMMAVLVTAFLSFHLSLTSQATTTIESCEKQRSGTSLVQGTPTTGSIYDRGYIENFKTVLGPRVWLWWAPLDAPTGSGVHFLVAPLPLLRSSSISTNKPSPAAPNSEADRGDRQAQEQGLGERLVEAEKLSADRLDDDTFSVSTQEDIKDEAQPEVEPGVVQSADSSSIGSGAAAGAAAGAPLRPVRSRRAKALREPEWTGPRAPS